MSGPVASSKGLTWEEALALIRTTYRRPVYPLRWMRYRIDLLAGLHQWQALLNAPQNVELGPGRVDLDSWSEWNGWHRRRIKRFEDRELSNWYWSRLPNLKLASEAGSPWGHVSATTAREYLLAGALIVTDLEGGYPTRIGRKNIVPRDLPPDEYLRNFRTRLESWTISMLLQDPWWRSGRRQNREVEWSSKKDREDRSLDAGTAEDEDLSDATPHGISMTGGGELLAIKRRLRLGRMQTGDEEHLAAISAFMAQPWPNGSEAQPAPVDEKFALRMRLQLCTVRTRSGHWGRLDPGYEQVLTRFDAEQVRSRADLTAQQREVIAKRYTEDRTQQSAADSLGLSRSSIDTQEKRALAKLRESAARLRVGRLDRPNLFVVGKTRRSRSDMRGYTMPENTSKSQSTKEAYGA